MHGAISLDDVIKVDAHEAEAGLEYETDAVEAAVVVHCLHVLKRRPGARVRGRCGLTADHERGLRPSAVPPRPPPQDPVVEGTQFGWECVEPGLKRGRLLWCRRQRRSW